MKLDFDVSAKEYAILRNILEDHLPRGVKVWVFGSRAKHTARFNSDIDLALESSEPLPGNLIPKLKDAFTEAPIAYRVDLVDMTEVSEGFAEIIRTQAVLFPMGERRDVPKLRFPDFEATLARVKLGDVATFSKGKGISKSDIDPDGDQPCIRYGELYTVYDTIIDQPISKTSIPASNLKLSKGDEVLVPASGEDAKDIATAVVVKQAGVALGGDLNIIQSKNDGAFLASYLSGRKRMALAALAQGNSVVHLYPAQLKTLDLHLPTLPEQRKIAAFLSAVDTKIAQLAEKKRLLEDYKKGCMQQLFSQKIRFKDEDGNDFPDWEEKRLGELCDVSSSKRVLQKDWLEEGVPFLRTREIIDLSKGVRFRTPIFISEKLFEELKAKYGTPKEGDILVTGVGSIGETYVVKGSDKFYFKDGNVLWIKKSRKLDPNFLNYLFQTPSVKKQLSDNASITTVATFTIDGAKKTILCYPHPAEQRKIADFLSALDRKIDLVAQELTHARSFKAGLLQQMFV